VCLSDDLVLNVAKINKSSLVNGPGNRFVLWLQGCSLRCPGCINHEFSLKEPRTLISVSELYRIIICTPDIEGVTYSGGEPFEQAKSLFFLSNLLKQKGLTIVSYSGFTYDEILNSKDEYKKLLLSLLDILIDGRYDKNKAIHLLWRGSSNQKIYFLSESYKDYEEIANSHKIQMEFAIHDDEVSVTGNFSEDILKKVKDRMKSYGIEMQVRKK